MNEQKQLKKLELSNKALVKELNWHKSWWKRLTSFLSILIQPPVYSFLVSDVGDKLTYTSLIALASASGYAIIQIISKQIWKKIKNGNE